MGGCDALGEGGDVGGVGDVEDLIDDAGIGGGDFGQGGVASEGGLISKLEMFSSRLCRKSFLRSTK